MKTSNKGIALIKRHEGFVPRAYLCPAGVWTIGYGHTSGVKKGQVITPEIGEMYLRTDLNDAEYAVNGERLNLTQNQFDALVSFVFNLGSGNFRSSTLLKRVRKNPKDTEIRGEFAKWNKARLNGVLTPLPGLTKRRRDEADLYFTA